MEDQTRDQKEIKLHLSWDHLMGSFSENQELFMTQDS